MLCLVLREAEYEQNIYLSEGRVIHDQTGHSIVTPLDLKFRGGRLIKRRVMSPFVTMVRCSASKSMCQLSISSFEGSSMGHASRKNSERSILGAEYRALIFRKRLSLRLFCVACRGFMVIVLRGTFKLSTVSRGFVASSIFAGSNLDCDDNSGMSRELFSSMRQRMY